MNLNFIFLSTVVLGLALAGCQSVPSSNRNNSKNDVHFGSETLVLPTTQESKRVRNSNPPSCLEFWERLSATTDFADAVKGHFQFPPECENPTASLIGSQFANAIKACLVATGDNDDFSSDCLMKLTFYRLSLIDKMSAEMENYEKASSDMLYNRFVLQYMIPVMVLRNSDFQITDEQKILDVLKSRLPQSFRVAKSQAALNLVEWATSPVEKKAATSAKLEKALFTALKLNPDDEEIREVLWVTMLQQNQRDELRQDLTQYMTAHPDSRVGRYFQAEMAWEMKDRIQCRNILEKLAKQFSDDTRISNTLSALQSAKFGDKIFTLNTKLSFN